ncbi:MAG: 50S ribosomal protein L11 methyltransferase [Candidatus Binatia bacterium]
MGGRQIEPAIPLWHKISVTSSWLQLSVRAAPAALDIIGNFLIERGSPGVVLKGSEVRAFFPSSGMASTLKRDVQQFLRGISEIFPEVTGQPLRWTVLEDKNWNDSWRRFFSPQKVAKGFLVTPPWLSTPRSAGRKVITIEPGMAFGTGTHPTTRCCLELLEEVTAWQTREKIAALDVGTGSGILAIALAKMGVREILALDNDPIALKVAQANIRRNRVRGAVTLSNTGLKRVKGPFTIVVANLTAETIIDLAPALRKQVSRGGYLILSGILNQRIPEVVRVFVTKPFALVRQKDSKGWTTLLFIKER